MKTGTRTPVQEGAAPEVRILRPLVRTFPLLARVAVVEEDVDLGMG